MVFSPTAFLVFDILLKVVGVCAFLLVALVPLITHQHALSRCLNSARALSFRETKDRGEALKKYYKEKVSDFVLRRFRAPRMSKFAFLKLPAELQCAVVKEILEALPDVIYPHTNVLYAHPIFKALATIPAVRKDAFRMFLSRATLILDIGSFTSLAKNKLLFTNLKYVGGLTICMFSFQNRPNTNHVSPTCETLGRFGIYCPLCHFKYLKRTKFYQALPWNDREKKIETTEFIGLTNLKTLTIEICDWDFHICNGVFHLIKEFTRNSPCLRTLIFRIRLQPPPGPPNVLPVAMPATSFERVRLIGLITADLATLVKEEVLENEERGLWSELRDREFPFLFAARSVGKELRLTFAVNVPGV